MSGVFLGGWVRRLSAITVAFCAVVFALGANPADAAPVGLTFTTPGLNAQLAAAPVQVGLDVGPGTDAAAVRLVLNLTHDITPRLTRSGTSLSVALAVSDGLLTGSNELVATAPGPGGKALTATTFFSLAGGALRDGPTLPLETFALRSRVADTDPAVPAGVMVTVGDNPHTPPAPDTGGCGRGVWVLGLARDTLGETTSRMLPLCTAHDAEQLGSFLKGLSDSSPQAGPPLVIVNSIAAGTAASSRAPAQLAAALAPIGANGTDLGAVDLGVQEFSVVGVRGVPVGQASVSVQPRGAAAPATGSPTPASVNGTLVQDNYEHFTLTKPDDVLFDIASNGTVTFPAHHAPIPAGTLPAAKAYPLPSPQHPGFVGGFHLVAFDRRTLALRVDSLFETNGSASLTERRRMDDAVRSLGESAFVLVSAVGSPIPPASDDPTGVCADPEIVDATVTCTFHQTGAEQQFVVPGGVVESMDVTAVGAVGGHAGTGGSSGKADVVTARLTVGAPGSSAAVTFAQQLYVEVGGNGGSGVSVQPVRGGFNGGGGGASGTEFGGYGGGGGGGATDLRTCPRLGTTCPTSSADSRIIVAAGGGGGGGSSFVEVGSDQRGGNGGDARHPGGNGVDGASGGQAGQDGGAGGPGSSETGDKGTAAGGGDGGAGHGHGGAGGGGGGGVVGGGGGGGQATSGGGGGGGGGSDLVPAGGTAATDTTGKALLRITYTLVPTVAQILRRLGGTPGVVNSADSTHPYALAGVAAPPDGSGLPRGELPEASALLQNGATGDLSGVLTRGERNQWYALGNWSAPVVTVINGKTQAPTRPNLGLADVLANVTAPWPVPVSAPAAVHDAQAAAYRDISHQLCGSVCPDVRAQYNQPQGTIQTRRDNLEALSYQPVSTYSADDFRVVQKQVLSELQAVILVDSLESTMHGLLSDENQLLAGRLQAALKGVNVVIAVGPTTRVLSVLQKILSALPTLLQLIPGLGDAVGVMASLVSKTIALTTTADGTLQNQLTTDAASLAAQTSAAFAASLGNLDQTFGAVLADWGKLSTLATGLNSYATTWSITDTSAAVTALASGAEVGYYQALLPAVLQRYHGTRAATGDLSDWSPKDNGTFQVSNVFGGHTPGTDYFSFPISAAVVGGNNFGADNLVIGVHPVITHSYADHATVYVGGLPPPAHLMSRLAQLGVYPGQLAERWSLPTLTCPSSPSSGTWCYDDNPLTGPPPTPEPTPSSSPSARTPAPAPSTPPAHSPAPSTPPAQLPAPASATAASPTVVVQRHTPLSSDIDGSVVAAGPPSGLASTGTSAVVQLVVAGTLAVLAGILILAGAARLRRRRSPTAIRQPDGPAER